MPLRPLNATIHGEVTCGMLSTSALQLIARERPISFLLLHRGGDLRGDSGARRILDDFSHALKSDSVTETHEHAGEFKEW